MNTPSNSPRIVFFQVADNDSKLKKVVETSYFHFKNKEPILILVENPKVQEFVDTLLWKFPSTSFFPHVATDEEGCRDFVAITQVKKNVNHAKIAFNLCSTPLLMDGPFKIIYELEDLTSLNKKNLSSLRFDAYKQAGFLIEAR